jgi:hypothetical protein
MKTTVLLFVLIIAGCFARWTENDMGTCMKGIERASPHTVVALTVLMEISEVANKTIYDFAEEKCGMFDDSSLIQTCCLYQQISNGFANALNKTEVYDSIFDIINLFSGETPFIGRSIQDLYDVSTYPLHDEFIQKLITETDTIGFIFDFAEIYDNDPSYSDTIWKALEKFIRASVDLINITHDVAIDILHRMIYENNHVHIASFIDSIINQNVFRLDADETVKLMKQVILRPPIDKTPKTMMALETAERLSKKYLDFITKMDENDRIIPSAFHRLLIEQIDLHKRNSALLGNHDENIQIPSNIVDSILAIMNNDLVEEKQTTESDSVETEVSETETESLPTQEIEESIEETVDPILPSQDIDEQDEDTTDPILPSQDIDEQVEEPKTEPSDVEIDIEESETEDSDIDVSVMSRDREADVMVDM